jgi:hypothetical protein
VDLRDPGLLDETERPRERLLVLAREADDHVRREIEVRERLQLGEVLWGGVAAAHRVEHAVVARLERDVQVCRDRFRLTQRGDELAGYVIDLDRREPKPLDPRDRPYLPHEAGKREPRLTVAEAAEVDSRENDLTMTLQDAPPGLGEDRAGLPAPRSSAHERDHAEGAREGAAVLDLHERTGPFESRLGLRAANCAHVACDDTGSLLARARDHDHVLRRPCEDALEVRAAASHVHATMRAGGARDHFSRLRDGLVGDAAGVDDRNVAGPVGLHMTVGEQALADGLGIRKRDLAAEEVDEEGRHRSPVA